MRIVVNGIFDDVWRPPLTMLWGGRTFDGGSIAKAVADIFSDAVDTSQFT